VHSLPIFVRLQGRPVILIGDGEAADAKRRLLERAGARIVGENAEAQLAIVALDDPDQTVARLKARNILVNAVDRPDLCDFTLPAIVDRDPVLVAIGTGGVSAGLAASLRQRLERLLPASLGSLANDLRARRAESPDPADRRRAIERALDGGEPALSGDLLIRVALTSSDPDDLTLRQARLLGQADRVFHRADVPAAILDRARADAPRIACAAPPADPGSGLSLDLAMADR
jgi:uroporphyrin-III C-methyltransferase / precorrin-2 dehydrogenase / sirohydrochlorin ferrochelatase